MGSGQMGGPMGSAHGQGHIRAFPPAETPSAAKCRMGGTVGKSCEELTATSGYLRARTGPTLGVSAPLRQKHGGGRHSRVLAGARALPLHGPGNGVHTGTL